MVTFIQRWYQGTDFSEFVSVERILPACIDALLFFSFLFFESGEQIPAACIEAPAEIAHSSVTSAGVQNAFSIECVLSVFSVECLLCRMCSLISPPCFLRNVSYYIRLSCLVSAHCLCFHLLLLPLISRSLLPLSMSLFGTCSVVCRSIYY